MPDIRFCTRIQFEVNGRVFNGKPGTGNGKPETGNLFGFSLKLG